MMRGERAQAVGIFRLFLALGVGAVVYWILQLVTDPLFARASESAASNSAGAQGTAYLQQGVQFFPLAAAMISFFGLIAYSVFTREVLA